MSEQPTTPQVTLTSPHDLPSMIAHLLGYQPSAGSVAFLGVADGSIVVAYNIDGARILADEWPLAIASSADLAAQRRWEIVVLAYGSADLVDGRGRDVLAAFTAQDVAVDLAFRLDDQRLYCLLCTACRWHDTQLPRATSALQADLVYAGLYAEPDRDSLMERLAPIDAHDQQLVQVAIDAAADRLAAVIADSSETPVGVEKTLTIAGLAAVDDAIAANAQSVALTDAQAGWLLLMLLHLPARDHALQVSAQSPPTRLWLDLLRRAPRGFQAPVACLAAWSAVFDGDARVANAALERAVNDDPDYRMTNLLTEAVWAGIPAQELREMFLGPVLDDGRAAPE